MKYNQTHLDVFKNHLSKDEGWAGSDIRKWWDYVTDKKKCNLASIKITRKELKNLCHKDSGYRNEECLGAVMAWGGQNRKHGKILFSRFDEIEPIIADMRNGNIDYIESYQRFDQVWQQNKPLGMGAAYFTKLIFFCEPSHQGFIMDQWTSKSTNLLCDDSVIHLQQGHVSKKNNLKTYGKFCSIVQGIAKEIDISPESVEMSMFSKGGRIKKPWRQHVVDTYK